MEKRRDLDRKELLERALSNLFGDLSPESRREIFGHLELVHLRGGDRLLSQGEPGDAMYVVMGGRLRALVRNDTGDVRVLGEIYRGESVGEMALITGEVRNASIEAIRDSILIRLSRASFENLIRSRPGLLLNLVRLVVTRLTRTERARGRNSRIRSVAVIFHGESVPRGEFLRRLTETFGLTARPCT